MGGEADLGGRALVELNRPMGLFGFLAIQERLDELLGCPVDLAQAEALKPRVRERVLKEAVRADWAPVRSAAAPQLGLAPSSPHEAGHALRP